MLSACATAPQMSPEPVAKRITYPSPPPPAADGSVYHAGYGVALFEDVRPRRVGDTVTVVVAESTNATKKATTSTSKDNSVDIANPTLFGQPVGFRYPGGGSLANNTLTLEQGLSSSKSFTGEGESAQSNNLTGSITAMVVEVLPNGNLRIEGEKTIAINQGDEHVRISGIVRPVDVRADNTVLSTLVADAVISYGGKGVIADASDMGWLSRFFNSKWWPF